MTTCTLETSFESMSVKDEKDPSDGGKKIYAVYKVLIPPPPHNGHALIFIGCGILEYIPIAKLYPIDSSQNRITKSKQNCSIPSTRSATADFDDTSGESIRRIS